MEKERDWFAVWRDGRKIYTERNGDSEWKPDTLLDDLEISIPSEKYEYVPIPKGAYPLVWFCKAVHWLDRKIKVRETLRAIWWTAILLAMWYMFFHLLIVASRFVFGES